MLLRTLPRIFIFCLLLMLLSLTILTPANYSRAAGPYLDTISPDDLDSAIPNGRFYPQAGPGGGMGFAVVDTAEAPIYRSFISLGGVNVLGYPVSRRYTADGFTYQAFQRGILQFSDSDKNAHLVNVFDYFHQLDDDPTLDAAYGVPPHISSTGAATNQQDRATRMSWLSNDAIKTFYLANPNPSLLPVWSSPDFYGLPTSKPEQRGPFIVQRFQRIAIQVWIEAVTGAPPVGSVTMVLGGDLAKTAGLIPADALLPEPPPGLLNPPAPMPSALLQSLVPAYISTAQANTFRTADQRLLIIPSGAYHDAIYVRDSFYAALGLNDRELSKSSYQWFIGSQDSASGQIPSALPLDPGNTSIVPHDDECTLLMIIWAYTLKQQGEDIDLAPVGRSLKYVLNHVSNGYYVSKPGAFRYWADNFVVRSNPQFPGGGDAIAYNQGLYVLAVEAARAMGLTDVNPMMVAQAKAAYRSFYRPDLGHMTLSKGSSYQDLSALLPEFLYRQIFRRAVLTDDIVEATVRHALNTGLVRYADGRIAGLKTIAASDGSFLARDAWSIPELAVGGDYQNGGYWPRDGLIALCLLYRVTKDEQVRSDIESLVARELSDGKPKEYLMMQQAMLGKTPSVREGYSWNVLVVPAFRFAGLIQ